MRIALVTGGSRGLGLSLCAQLNASGYRVLEFSRGAPHQYSSQVDLASPTAAINVAAVLSSIDPDPCEELLVISNAGTLSPIGPVWNQRADQTLENLNINLVSAIGFIAEAMRHFRKSRARKVIVNVSSGAALKGYAGWSLYCAAKAGMENYIRAIAVEEGFQAHPFVPVSINPGVIDTNMQALIREAQPDDFPEVERFRTRKISGGLAHPEVVARGIIAVAARSDLEAGKCYDLPTAA